MTPDLLDRSDLDTWLATALLRDGRLPRQALRALLEQARRDRGLGGPSLARTLVGQGLLPAPELEALLQQAVTLAPPGETRPPARRLGELELLERLGAGGMGTVYRARNLRTGAEYALKTLVASDPELLERFQREGEGQARVGDHPNVVKVHTLGHEGGTFYLVMDLLEGGSLADRLKAGLPAPEEAAGWVRDLAGALEYAHARGVLHRDLKPENVLFDGPTPKLVDFGLAKLQDAQSLTATGTVLGTPGYMAPEQVDATRGAMGAATDVYGLGALLYACLTGRAPFAGGSALAVMIQVLEEAPTPPRALRPEVPPALEAVCLRALEKDPAARYPSAAALAAALDAALADPDAVSRGLPVGLLLAALGLALLLVAVVAVSWPAHPAGPPTQPSPQLPEVAVSPPQPPPTPTPSPSPEPAAPGHPPARYLRPPPPPREGKPTLAARLEKLKDDFDAIRNATAPPAQRLSEGRRLIEILRGYLQEPACVSQRGVYGLLAEVHLLLGEEVSALENLARSALIGDWEAAIVLGLAALPPDEQPRDLAVRWPLHLRKNASRVLSPVSDGWERLSAALLVLALNEPKPGGRIARRMKSKQQAQWSRQARHHLQTRGRRPSYADAYRLVWKAFPTARPQPR